MAIYNEENIPASVKRTKKVPSSITITGNEMDMGQGTIVIGSINRMVDENHDPIIGADGKPVYEEIDDSLVADIHDNINVEIDGTTLSDVLDWIGKFYDYLENNKQSE